jgi:hemerythrin superfamily protein/ribosome-associated toxin RatA of RatAB toxin-antitoxin module
VTTTVERTVTVEVPVRTAYNQWTQFEEYPQFMDGVEEVTQVDDTTLHWVAKIGGVRREWDAAILEQAPDQKVAWAATEGATNAGAVHFAPAGPDQTTVTLHLEFEPEGMVEKAGDALGVVERRAAADLERFKAFIEQRGTETGAWRGEVNPDLDVGTPGVEAAAASRGDSGKVGESGDTTGGAADVEGQDVVDVLTADHREATALVADIWATTDPQERRDLADQLIAELVRHAVAEEMYVYPAMRDHLPDGEAAVRHDIEEHQELESQMKQLEGLDGAQPQFTETLRQLESTLADHIADEEREHFPQLRASLPREELVQLAGKVEGAKKLAPTRPHPAAPNSELFHKVAGPGVGLVDRLRDRLSGRSTG